jgi:ribosomal protein S18 acetylase RimI-like enzyme
MDIQIRKLTPELVNDYLHFFDKKCIFAEKDWAGCYCTFYHRSENITDKREYARSLIEKGILQGYLAYRESKVIGWCNINTKSVYKSLPHNIELDDGMVDINKIKSIVCFTIDPDVQNQGVATELLKHACVEVQNSDVIYIEAYPDTKHSFNKGEYHGTYSMYEKAGFKEYKTYSDFVVMRKILK